VVVVLIVSSSAIAFYSIMYSVLTSQHSKYLLSATNDFIYASQEKIQENEDDFIKISKQDINTLFSSADLKEKNIDYVFETTAEGKILRSTGKDFVELPENIFRLEEFLKLNPAAIIKSYTSEEGNTFYYGLIFTSDLLNSISKKIGVDISIILNNFPLEMSNESLNKKYFSALTDAYQALSGKKSFEVFTSESETSDIIATICKPSSGNDRTGFNGFLIFTTLSETADLRSNLKYIFIIIGFAGVILSLILTFVFTDKIRKNISQLNKATEITKEGKFKNKILIKSKDELGDLAAAFNNMIDELEKNQKSKNEYSEFITLLNQNPSLKEITDAALRKIIKTGGFTVGALYSHNEGELNLASSYGVDKENLLSSKVHFFDTVIKNHETMEVSFDGNAPSIPTGIMNVIIKHLLIVPVIYNNKVIAVLELGAVEKPSERSKEYIVNIQEQLAIGLTNALAFVQMENLVNELKKLNDDYQKQNLQIKQQNETLIALHCELKEKAAELENQKVIAEESTKLKSQFLASMSHELRTPMNSILGLTELILEETALKGKDRERLDVVLKSGKRLMNLINDILDLSKIEAGKMELHEEEALLEEIISEVENTITPLIKNKEIKFRVLRNVNTKIYISTDKDKVTQLLINLAGNAVKFTDRGFVELHINTIEDKIKFDIIDSGIGIAESDQKYIFEEFRQLDGSTTRKYNGTGLGLAICKKIVEILKGTINVKSEKGKGSVFTLTIPLKFIRSEDPDKSGNVNIEALRKNIKNPILVIDDNPEIRYTIGQYLISKGYEVVYAEDGEKGIELAMKHQPFAITLDVMLPKKDGWNILRELKENILTKDIPVILLSIISDKNLGYGLGAFEYFVKPISANQLLSAFAKLENIANKRIEKIALVDDDELEFERFKRAFKNDNIRIDYIKESELAFSRILETQPDLIIVDLMMPNIDGVTLSHKLKLNKDTKHIPVIISTAKDMSDEEKKSLNNIVENITIKSNGHPLDVLKVVRDRIHIQEITIEKTENISNDRASKEIINDEQKSNEKIFNGDILIVDDDPDTLFTINEIIKSIDYRTILAKNGKECLTILEDQVPDLILLDIMMPEMDGFQTIKKIRQNSKLAHLPVVAVTAKAMLGDQQVILKHGFNDLIPKPVDANTIAFKIEKLFPKLNLT
jgi:signal transduction histidine kinase/CheY-like chemotaxis protein/HAMP domain-containing protein